MNLTMNPQDATIDDKLKRAVSELAKLAHSADPTGVGSERLSFNKE
jgi:hypothetical protein